MKHIAVVEDEALMREELADMLRRADYAVTEITDFSDVTGQLLALAPDLVLLDLNLPEVSGFQICRDIKQRSALPVLVLTSRDQMRDEVHALELGADEYLTKPYRRERLLRASETSSSATRDGRTCSRGQISCSTVRPIRSSSTTGPSSCRRIRASCSRYCWRTAGRPSQRTT